MARRRRRSRRTSRRTSRRRSRRGRKRTRRTRRSSYRMRGNTHRRRRRRTRRRTTMRPNRHRRRVRRNQYTGAAIMRDVVTPVLGGAAGFIVARWAGNMLAMRDVLTTDPRTGKLIAAAVGIPAVFAMARRAPGILRRNQGALVLGMGIAVAESYLRDVPMLGGSPAAAAITPEGAMPEGAIPGEPVPEAMLPGEMEIVENSQGAGAYYTDGMLGGLNSDQESVAAVSTIIPTDLALRAPTMPQVAPVSEPFVDPGNRGHAGGVFARHLFSGMIGGG